MRLRRDATLDFDTVVQGTALLKGRLEGTNPCCQDACEFRLRKFLPNATARTVQESYSTRVSFAVLFFRCW
jgi:hypothetical protein